MVRNLDGDIIFLAAYRFFGGHDFGALDVVVEEIGHTDVVECGVEEVHGLAHEAQLHALACEVLEVDSHLAPGVTHAVAERVDGAVGDLHPFRRPVGENLHADLIGI